MTVIDTTIDVEARRLETQYQLDAAKTQAERNRLGQFATPTILATDILEYAKTLLSDSQQIRFLDPAFGTGSFYAALLRSFSVAQIADAWGYEIDPHYGQEAIKLWNNTPLKLNIADFTRAAPPDLDDDRANLLICNPPYVRHHHLFTAEKSRLQVLAKKITGLKLSGLAGLYCYFLMIAHDWMADGALAGWLIPSEFMDVNYGEQVKQYLLQRTTLLRVHRFNPDNAQFGDALVSSAVVWLRKEKSPAGHEVEFNYGGTLAKPEVTGRIPVSTLRQATKWTGFPETFNNASFETGTNNRSKLTLSDLFNIKRGLVTGGNKFFILTPEEIKKHNLPAEFLIPILPSPRYLPANEVESGANGNPILERRLFLLACNLSEYEVKAQYPSLWKYLQIGVQQGLNKRYICRHRSSWYAQENRPATTLLCTYMGRKSAGSSKPFRFILNHSKATAPNVYLMLYPKFLLAQMLESRPDLLRAIWQALNQISPDVLIDKGRVYGGGLHKIEPNELGNTPSDVILEILPQLSGNCAKQLSLFE